MNLRRCSSSCDGRDDVRRDHEELVCDLVERPVACRRRVLLGRAPEPLISTSSKDGAHTSVSFGGTWCQTDAGAVSKSPAGNADMRMQ